MSRPWGFSNSRPTRGDLLKRAGAYLQRVGYSLLEPISDVTGSVYALRFKSRDGRPFMVVARGTVGIGEKHEIISVAKALVVLAKMHEIPIFMAQIINDVMTWWLFSPDAISRLAKFENERGPITMINFEQSIGKEIDATQLYPEWEAMKKSLKEIRVQSRF